VLDEPRRVVLLARQPPPEPHATAAGIDIARHDPPDELASDGGDEDMVDVVVAHLP
jgi:hypothetical protein